MNTEKASGGGAGAETPDPELTKGLGAPAVLPDHPSRESFERKHPNGDEVPAMIRKAFFGLWRDGWEACLASQAGAEPPPDDFEETYSMSMYANRADYEAAKAQDARRAQAGAEPLRELLRLAQPYVKVAGERAYDGTNGHGMRKEANRRLALIDAALAEPQTEPRNQE